MLKGIPKIIPSELLKILCEMGHGDTIVIADGNFPAESMGKMQRWNTQVLAEFRECFIFGTPYPVLLAE